MNADEIIKAYKLDKRQWTLKGFEANLHTFSCFGEILMKPFEEFYGRSFEIAFQFLLGNRGLWYWHEADLEKIRDEFIEKVNNDPEEIEKFHEECNRRMSLFVEKMDKVESADMTTLSNDELYALYTEWFDAYMYQYAATVCIQDAFSMHADRFLEPHFRNVIHDDFHTQFAVLMSPVELSFLKNEEKELLRIKIAEAKGEGIEPLLDEHVRRWHWIKNNYKIHKVLGEEFFKERMDAITEDSEKLLREIDEEIEHAKREKKKLAEALQIDAVSKNLIRITEVFTEIQDTRKGYIMRGIHDQFLFLEEYARRLGWTVEDMEWTYYHELPDVMAGKVTKDDLEQRKNYFIAVRTPEQETLLGGPVAEEVYNKLFGQEEEQEELVSGLVASTGKATGNVRIVFTAEDAASLKEGEVLVSTMTKPDVVFAMKKAAAIVTDEGGITSHAAIVSRELKKPCIIGTRKATKIFKNGDLVEVDGEKGTVTKV